MQTSAESPGASENGEYLEDRGMGALLGALERRQAGEIVILQLFGLTAVLIFHWEIKLQTRDQNSNEQLHSRVGGCPEGLAIISVI